MIPDLKVAFFQCSICGQTDQVTIDRGRIAEPTQCPTCHVRHGYSLIHNRCYYSDKQMVRIQETPDEVPAGETPASIVVFAYDDLVDAARPGDRVEVTGMFRAQARRVNPKITKVKSIYKTYVDEFDDLRVHFNKCCETYKDFQTTLKEFESLPKCQNLRVTFYMLKPVQRVPQYKMLLENYFKYLPEDSVDFEDTVDALKVVADVAEHCNASLHSGVKSHG